MQVLKLNHFYIKAGVLFVKQCYVYDMILDHGFYPSDWYSLATPGEQVTDTVIDDIVINVLRGGANCDNCLIQNTGLQQINQFEKGNGKIMLQPMHCGMRYWIFGTTTFGDNAIFDSMGNDFTDTASRASIQLFEENEGVLKLVWRKCTCQAEQLCFIGCCCKFS